MKIELDVSEKALIHMINYMNYDSDRYCGGGPLSPSNEWTELLEALEKSYESAKRIEYIMNAKSVFDNAPVPTKDRMVWPEGGSDEKV